MEPLFTHFDPDIDPAALAAARATAKADAETAEIRMAQFFLGRHRDGHPNTTAHDLARAGFTASEIVEHNQEAQAIATAAILADKTSDVRVAAA